jgi:DNA-binding CsgD family transcriptional regulator
MAYTLKETRIILMMAEGMSSAEIASKLGLSEDTISNNRKRILNKSDCRNWNHFMASYGRNGLLDEWLAKYQFDLESNGDEQPATIV